MLPSQMDKAIRSYLSASKAQQPTLFAPLIAALEKGAATCPEETAHALRHLVQPAMPYSSAEAFARIQKLLPGSRAGLAKRIAILGGFTTRHLTRFIELFLFVAGLRVEVYESEYGVFQQELLDPASGLYAFRPDLVFLAVN